MRLVLVTWQDSYLTEGWTKGDIDESALLCESVGYLIHHGDDVVVVAPHIAEDQRSGTMYIPVAAVVSIQDLIVVLNDGDFPNAFEEETNYAD